MERTLSKLFDFQKFEKNADLDRLVDAVHARYGMRELALDEMEMIAAAGQPNIPAKKIKEEHQ